MILVKIIISLSPVLVLALALLLLDGYKLVTLRSALFSLLKGALAALCALGLNMLMMNRLLIDGALFSKYIAPIIEEAVKAAPVVFLMRKKRIGFLVDAAIHGATIGAGFSVLENIYYLYQMPDTPTVVWFIRGFGTAVMHSSVTALFGILSKRMSDRQAHTGFAAVFPSFLAAAGMHSLFNHFLLPPIVTTLAIVIILPPMIVLVYENSERSLRSWLSMGMDEDMTMLEMILTGRVAESRIGHYLLSIRHHFAPSVVVDLLCYLRIYFELAIRAKGILLLRQNGIEAMPDPAVREKFNEFKYLEKSIGKTGKLALAPFMRLGNRELWQLYMLEGK